MVRFGFVLMMMSALVGCGKSPPRAGFVKLNALIWECTKTGPIDVRHEHTAMAGKVFYMVRDPDTKGTACTQWTMKGQPR